MVHIAFDICSNKEGKMKRIRGLLLFVLALFMVAGMSVSTANVFAKDTTVPEPKASMKAEGTLVINDIVPDSSGIPRSSCKYTYTISATSGTLSGTYTITKGATVVLADTPLPASGQFELCANETATISGLADGTYMVTQATPTYANYIDTTVSVNDSDPQKSLTANVNMVADQTTTVIFTNNYNVPTVNGDISTKPCELHWYAKSFINYLTENFPNENYLSKVKKRHFQQMWEDLKYNIGSMTVPTYIGECPSLQTMKSAMEKWSLTLPILSGNPNPKHLPFILVTPCMGGEQAKIFMNLSPDMLKHTSC